MNREAQIKEIKNTAEKLIYEENLPQASDLLGYRQTGKPSKKLKKVFDFFDNEEEFSAQIKRNDYRYTEEESKEFIDSVIASNVKEISESGSLYKKLLAAGDSYIIEGDDCGSEGRLIKVPDTKDNFIYNVRDMNVSFDKKTWQIFTDFDEFQKASKDHKELWVKSPLMCKEMPEHKVCKACAGNIKEDVKYIGAYSVLMVTETATQGALSSMNKGVEENINLKLTRKAKDVSTLDEFIAWANNILAELEDSIVERRWYEISLASRLIKTKRGVKVKSLETRSISNETPLGNFIYQRNPSNYQAFIGAGSFTDNSFKVKVAFDDFIKE